MPIPLTSTLPGEVGHGMMKRFEVGKKNRQDFLVA